MKTLLLLKVEDINCSVMGEHFTITTDDGTVLNFTREAAEELHADISTFLGLNNDDTIVVSTNKNGKTEIHDKDGTLIGSQG